MARRIEVELTSSKDNGTWTWRAANARQPKGEVAASLLYEGAKVGDVVKVEADFHLDGIEIIEVFPPKQKKERTDLLKLVSRPISDDELVTTVRTGRGDRDDRPGGRKRRDDGPRGERRDGAGRGDRRPGGGSRDGAPRDGANRGGPAREGGNRFGGGGGDGAGRGRSDRGPRRPQEDERPKAKRLRPGRTHRNAALAAVAEEHRPIAEQVLRGGLPAVRTAIEKQNSEATEAGTPQVEVSTVLAIAEPMVGVFQAAEWRDRADAALAEIDELDLRDLRSVVVAADPTAKDEDVRALAEQLKAGLAARLEKDQAEWVRDLTSAVDGGRTIRALRLSSRPVKAGSPLPAEVAAKLTAAASAALSDDIASDRWAAVVDALAYSPVRGGVTPAGYPAEPTPELLEAVKRIADRVPQIAAHFGIDAAASAAAKRRRPKKDAPKRVPSPPAVGSAAPTAAAAPTASPADATPAELESGTPAPAAIEAAEAHAELESGAPAPAAIEAAEPHAELEAAVADAEPSATEAVEAAPAETEVPVADAPPVEAEAVADSEPEAAGADEPEAPVADAD